MLTSPANSVLTSKVFASDFTMDPVSRSPFCKVTWSALAAADAISHRTNTSIVCLTISS